METNNRRSFLKAGGLIGALFLAAPLVSTASGNEKNLNSSKPEKMKERILGTGKHSLKVNYGLGLGCMGMSWHRTFIPERKPMIALIQKAYEMGVNLFDTAEAYGPWRNEELVGEAIQPFRKKIILCSKFGFNIQDGKLAGFNSKPAHIREDHWKAGRNYQTTCR
jgi:aryl-alcohol dehydrogenase-like predicted oxidoreductase